MNDNYECCSTTQRERKMKRLRKIVNGGNLQKIDKHVILIHDRILDDEENDMKKSILNLNKSKVRIERWRIIFFFLLGHLPSRTESVLFFSFL